MIETIRDILKRHEGVRLKVYKCPSGYTTIGVGHNIDAKGLPAQIRAYLDEHGEITEEMSDSLLAIDILDAEQDCKELYPDFLLFSATRQKALIDFVFQLGKAGAGKFVNTNKHINSGDWDRAADNMVMSLWFKQTPNRAAEIIKLIKEG